MVCKRRQSTLHPPIPFDREQQQPKREIKTHIIEWIQFFFQLIFNKVSITVIHLVRATRLFFSFFFAFSRFLLLCWRFHYSNRQAFLIPDACPCPCHRISLRLRLRRLSVQFISLFCFCAPEKWMSSRSIFDIDCMTNERLNGTVCLAFWCQQRQSETHIERSKKTSKNERRRHASCQRLRLTIWPKTGTGKTHFIINLMNNGW